MNTKYYYTLCVNCVDDAVITVQSHDRTTIESYKKQLDHEGAVITLVHVTKEDLSASTNEVFIPKGSVPLPFRGSQWAGYLGVLGGER